MLQVTYKITALHEQICSVGNEVIYTTLGKLRKQYSVKKRREAIVSAVSSFHTVSSDLLQNMKACLEMLRAVWESFACCILHVTEDKPPWIKVSIKGFYL